MDVDDTSMSPEGTTKTVTAELVTSAETARAQAAEGLLLPLQYPPGAADDYVWTTDDSGNGSWQPAAVVSVNGQTGGVTLTAASVGADASGAAATAQGTAETYAATQAASAQSAAQSFATSAVATETGRAETAEALALAKASNLADLASAATARTNLGLGTAATQASSAFDASGAAATAQGTAESFATSAVAAETSRAETAEGLAAQKSANLSDLGSASTARTNLGLGTAATQASSAFDASGAAATAQGTAETYAATQAASAQSAAQSFATSAVATEASRAETAETALSGVSTDWLNVVTKYGADPTGATDAHAAIQNAINAAHTAGGGVVYLPAGTYKLTTGLSVPSFVILRGAGSAGTGGTGTTLHMTAANTHLLSITGTSGTPLQSLGVHDMTLTGPGQGSGSTGCGIYISYASNNVTFSNLLIIGHGSHGVYQTQSYNVMWRECWLDANGGHGFFGQTSVNAVCWIRCIFDNNTLSGCKIEAGAASAFLVCDFESNANYGLELHYCYAFSVLNSDFENNGTDGVSSGAYLHYRSGLSEKCEVCLISGCNFTGAGHTVSGVVFDGADGCRVEMCQFANHTVSDIVTTSNASRNWIGGNNYADATPPLTDGSASTVVFDYDYANLCLRAKPGIEFEGITAPPANVAGLLWYNSATNQLAYYNGTASQILASLAGASFTGPVLVNASSAGGGLFRVINTHSAPSVPSSTLQANAAGDLALGILVAADQDFRLTIDSNGKLRWSSGSALTDANLYRSGAGTLATDGALTLGTPLAITSGGTAATSAGAALTSLGAASASALTTETSRAEAAEALLAPLASPALTGTPTAPTKAALTNNTDIATTAYGDAAVAVETSRAQSAEGLLAPKASPAFTGVPTAPTAAALTSTTQLASTAYADSAVAAAAPSSGTPLALTKGGTGLSETTTASLLAALGALQLANNLSDLNSASTARTNLGLGTAATQASSAFDASGAAAAAQGTAESFATAAVATETTRAEAAEALLAPLASPALTGTPTAPTKTALTSNTDIATTAYADSAVGVETTRATTAEALIPLIDTTATDITPPGTQAAGNSTKAAAANHVHPLPNGVDCSDYGYLAWNGDPMMCITVSAATTSQTAYVAKVMVRSPLTISKIAIAFSNTPSMAASSGAFLALYDHAGTKVGSTSDQSTVWNAAGVYSPSIGSQNLTAQAYYVLLIVGAVASPTITTAPAVPVINLVGAGTAIVEAMSIALSAPRWGTAGTSLTSLPASITPTSLGNTSTKTFLFWCALL